MQWPGAKKRRLLKLLTTMAPPGDLINTCLLSHQERIPALTVMMTRTVCKKDQTVYKKEPNQLK